MFSKSVGARRRRVGALAATAALCATALVTTSTVSGAEVRTQKSKIDKSAVIRMGIGVGDNGGSSFDPANSRPNPYNAEWMDLVYDVLIHDTPDGKGAPGLATKWSTPDPSTAEITLRSGVKFTDGTPLTAAAAKTAWEKLLAANLFTTPNDIKAITSIETPTDTSLRIHFNAPVAETFLANSTHHSWWLGIPSPTAAATGNLNTKPVGAGPYQLKDYVQDQKITLEKNPSYWDPKSQLAGGWEFIQASAGPPAVNALTSGTVDLIWSIPPDATESLKNNPNLTVTGLPGTRVFDVGLCATQGTFASKEARQAIQYALDRDALNSGAMADTGLPWQTVIGPTSPYYNKKLNSTYKYSVSKAKALLKQAGIAEGTTIKGLASNSVPQPQFAEIVQAQLKKVGLNLDFSVSTNLVDDANRQKPDMLFVGFDPSLWGFAFNQTSTLNICGWSNPTVTANIATMQDGSKTEAEKKAAADSMQKILLDESPDIITVLSPLTTAQNKAVKGITTIQNPFGPQLATVYKTSTS
jgi:peptide/nickel transport system substrate-binding protein